MVRQCRDTKLVLQGVFLYITPTPAPLLPHAARPSDQPQPYITARRLFSWTADLHNTVPTTAIAAMSSPIPKKILIFGATGVIGKYITREIVHARSSFEKIGIFTSAETARDKPEIGEWQNAGVEVIVGDVNSESDVKKAYEGTYKPPLPGFQRKRPRRSPLHSQQLTFFFV